ncbi:MAG TPA: hypothetical protein VHW93_01810 [Acidimicrobiales bacterium]|jgi:hypothetical protein|nr:hypothetical protein [Acidimicrobiales bacterium]
MFDENPTATTIYASRVVACPEQAWRGVRFPVEVEVPEARLTIGPKEPASGQAGFPDETRSATLRFGRLRTPLRVDVETTRWTPKLVEIGVRPPRHLPFWVSEERYVRASHAVLDRLARTFSSPTATQVELGELLKTA